MPPQSDLLEKVGLLSLYPTLDSLFDTQLCVEWVTASVIN